jgi:hypothetical protein
MNRLIPVELFSPREISPPNELHPRDYQTGGKLFSLVSVVTEANGQSYTIQLAQDRSVDEQFEKQFGLLVAAVLVCGIFASAMIAITVNEARSAALGAMTRSLKRVGPNRLHERVLPTGMASASCSRLAVAFDDMLDRLEDSFTRPLAIFGRPRA